MYFLFIYINWLVFINLFKMGSVLTQCTLVSRAVKPMHQK